MTSVRSSRSRLNRRYFLLRFLRPFHSFYRRRSQAIPAAEPLPPSLDLLRRLRVAVEENHPEEKIKKLQQELHQFSTVVVKSKMDIIALDHLKKKVYPDWDLVLQVMKPRWLASRIQFAADLGFEVAG